MSRHPLELLAALGRRRRWLVLAPLVAAAIAAGVSLVLPFRFTAVTRILPPQPAQSTAVAMLSQLGGLAGAAGNALGLKNPSELYLGMLRSETVADAVLGRFRLRERWGLEYQVESRERLAGRTLMKADKSGIITIQVTAEEPGLAADMANAYVEELHRLTSTLAVTEASQRRAFFEKQLQQAREKLADAEAGLRSAIERGGLASAEVQGRVAVETVARLRAEITAKEVQIGAMRGYASAGNPDLQRAERELATMRREVQRLESGLGLEAPGEARGEAGAKGGEGNIRLVRDLKYQEVLFELLARQYELARVDESREAPVVQVLDRATPPEKRSFPRRTLMVLASAVLAGLAAVAAALGADAWERSRSDPAASARVEAALSAWLGRGPRPGA